MVTRASGTFEVKTAPLEAYNKDKDAGIGRMSLDKVFRGDLNAIAKGEMLGAGKPDKGSAGYVAMDYVSGTLHGHKGTFVLQHSGTMIAGALNLSITIVPNSGTGELAGLAGKLTIKIENGQHFYELDYTI